MFNDVAAFLRAEGWGHWNVLLDRRRDDIVWDIFDNEHAYPAIVAKQYAAGPSAARGRREADALGNLKRISNNLVIPSLRFRKELPSGEFLLIRSGVPGHPLRDELRFDDVREIHRQIQLVEPWLLSFQRLMHTDGPMSDAMLRAVQSCRERLSDLSPQEESLLSAAEGMKPILEHVPAIAVHGDFWAGNTLLYKKGISVIDWDNLHYGNPLEDPYQFLVGAVLSRTIATEKVIWDVFIDQCPLSSMAREISFRFLDSWQIKRDLLYPLFLQFLVSRLCLTEFRAHEGWRRFVNTYVRAGMPSPLGKL